MTVIEGMERAKAIVLRRTQIPEGAHEPTRDAIVVLGEHIAELIDQEIVRELQAQGKAAVPEMTAEKNLAFDVAKGDWRVTGSYDEPDNIVFYHKGEGHKTITYPGYKIWNIAAHLDKILEGFERGMLLASWTGFGSVEYAVKEETE